MKKRLILLTSFVFYLIVSVAQTPVIPPDKIYGDLFRDVQMSRVFPDGKTFVDCIPKRNPKTIVADYTQQKGTPKFDLKQFVLDNFELPRTPQLNYITQEKYVIMHIKN